MKPGKPRKEIVGVVAPKKRQTRRLKPKKVLLSGAERYWIQERIENLKRHERNAMEERLLQKVKRRTK